MLRSALQRGLRVASSSFTVLHPVSRIDAVQRCQVATTVGGATSPSPRRLDEVLKLDDLEGKSAAEIASIWTEYHKDPGKGRIADVLPAEDYSDFAEKAAKSPMFVLPMARGPSQLQNLLLQMQLPHAFFTTLDEYKVLGPDAPIHLAITYYKELEQPHGIVLSRGDIISPNVARQLMGRMHTFYSSSEAYQHVHAFNHDQTNFDYSKLLAQLGIQLPA